MVSPATLWHKAGMDIEQIYRQESGRILATLIRLLGSFDLAEEAMQEAFATALEKWAGEGAPSNPRAWLISAGHHKGLDILRRQTRIAAKQPELQKVAEVERELAQANEKEMWHQASCGNGPDHEWFGDDRLRLIFTCCHPALAIEAQVALTLKTLCGLTTEEIARAFLVPLPTMAQRLVRAKQKIRGARIPYQIPPQPDLAERVEAVLLVIYLVFNEGYSASSGEAAIRHELCSEAIRVCRILCQLMPKETEARALLALMLLHDARRMARTSETGDIVLLEQQDRSRWNRQQIDEGLCLVESALRDAPPGAYAVQAAIAAVHSRALRSEETDWAQIVALYRLLLQLQPSPVVELNFAAAVAMTEGPAAGLTLLDRLETKPEMEKYYLLPAARADLLRRLERWREAADSYRRALALAPGGATRNFLSEKLNEMENKVGTATA